jgi:hypothetical protein
LAVQRLKSSSTITLTKFSFRKYDLSKNSVGHYNYDHVEDVKWHESEASVLMIVMRVSDPDQADIVKLVCDIRTRRSLPVIVVHTCLHESYGDEKNHPVGYPFVGDESDSRNPSIPRELRNRIAYQRQGFKGMKGEPPIFVVIDLSEDFSPTDYGRQALVEATAAAVTSVSDQLLHDMAGVSRLLRLWPFKSKFRYEVHEARVVRRKAQFGARLRDALTGGLGAVR